MKVAQLEKKIDTLEVFLDRVAVHRDNLMALEDLAGSFEAGTEVGHATTYLERAISRGEEELRNLRWELEDEERRSTWVETAEDYY